MSLTYKKICKLAIPASIASMVTPLLGLVDAAVLARSPRPLDIGAVGLAAAIFSLAYWTFGFLRMSTAGLTAQAAGAEDEVSARRILAQSAGLGAMIGLILIIFQAPFATLSFWAMTQGTNLSPETLQAAQSYFSIRIYSAPFSLVTYGLLGWLTARGRTDILMVVSIFMTLLNMALDILFVLYFDYGPSGIAAGTLIAEIMGALGAIWGVCLVLKQHGGLYLHWQHLDYFNAISLKRLLGVNVDIFIRTLILVLSFVYFTQRSATYGDLTLSANQLLLQFFLVTGLALDGTAIAAESLVGQSLGRRDPALRRIEFQRVAIKTSVVAGIAALGLVLFYLLFGQALLTLTAPATDIHDMASRYFPWIVISPLIVATSFQLDGIYIGATRSKALRNSMVLSGIAYLIALHYLTPEFQNHGLWAAFFIFMLARAATLLAGWPGFEKLFAASPKKEI